MDLYYADPVQPLTTGGEELLIGDLDHDLSVRGVHTLRGSKGAPTFEAAVKTSNSPSKYSGVLLVIPQPTLITL